MLVFCKKRKSYLSGVISNFVIELSYLCIYRYESIIGLVILSCIAMLFVKYLKINLLYADVGKLYKLFTKYSFIIFAAIAIYFQYTYNPELEWMGKLNTMFSGRLALGHWGFELYGIQPFGSFVEFTTMLEATETNKFFYIDSAYVQLLLVYGAIIFAFSVYRLYKNWNKSC